MAEKKAKIDVEKLKLKTTEFRVSHPHIFKPSAMEGSKTESYSIEMLFDKSTTKLSDIQRPLLFAAADKWGTDKADWPEPLQWAYRDGDKPRMNKKTKKMEVKEEHKGMWVVRANSSADYQRPWVVGRDPKIALEDESELYPGCYARASLKAHPWEFGDKFGVKFILGGVQFIRDGKAIGGKRPAHEVFGVIEGDDGEDDVAFETESEEGEESFL